MYVAFNSVCEDLVRQAANAARPAFRALTLFVLAHGKIGGGKAGCLQQWSFSISFTPQ